MIYRAFIFVLFHRILKYLVKNYLHIYLKALFTCKDFHPSYQNGFLSMNENNVLVNDDMIIDQDVII